MHRALNEYLTKEVCPRWKDLLKGSELWISFVVGVIVFNDCGFSLMEHSKNGDIGILLLTYAAIALGFTLTGMTITLTLPEREFAYKLVSSKINEKGRDAYSDLLFVFSWTAFIHWVLLLSVAFFLVYFGFEGRVLEVLSFKRRLFIAGMAFETLYCLCQFLITVLTLTQVGHVYIKFLRDNPSKKHEK